MSKAEGGGPKRENEGSSKSDSKSVESANKFEDPPKPGDGLRCQAKSKSFSRPAFRGKADALKPVGVLTGVVSAGETRS